ncbi:MAG TPA: hypothetical protein VEL69_02395 [Ktedonobacteraceae bacterium]|nr:hypothetical protein [Ktedonobacteraceae bacterium]
MEDTWIIPKAWLLTLVAGFLIGFLILLWMFVLGPLFNQVEYNNYNNSPQHIQAVAQKFSDDCLQISEAKDPVTVKAIEQDIYSVAATVDLNLVHMPDATRACVDKALKDVTHK